MDSENQRYGRNKNTLVNKSYIDSGEYRKKFDALSDNESVNKTLYDCSKAALKHRSGTINEDMYWIDGDTGKSICSVTDSVDDRGIRYSSKIENSIKNYNNVVTVHTHPGSMPPSISDFNSCNKYGYSFGIVACHNGKVFKYTSNQEVSEDLYNLYIVSFMDKGYSEYDAQYKTLCKIKENYLIDFWEV